VEARARGGGEEVTLRASDGRRATLAVVSRRRISPRDVPYLLRERRASKGALLLVAPFLGPRTRELLAEANASYVDATGNVRVVVGEPAVYLESRGVDRDPERKARPLRSLKGTAAARVVRALCDFRPPYGVRTLAAWSSSPLGTASRVVSFLEEEALLTRDAKKMITAVDWPGLLKRWAADYSVTGSNVMRAYLEPRGLTALAPKLRTLGRYAATGSLGGTGVAPARLAMLYVDDAEAAARNLHLVPAEAGANVWLLEPYDGVVFERTQAGAFGAESITVVAPSQAAVDLMTSPGRGPQEAQALIERMKGTEDAWRRNPRS